MGDCIAECEAGDGGRRRIEMCAEFAHESGHSAGVVEVRTGGLEVEQYGDLTAELIEGFEVDFATRAAR